MASSGLAKLWKPVINVTDLDAGESFWSAVSGLSPKGRHGQFSILDADNASDHGNWILLQLVPVGQVSTNSGTHLDFRVDDVADAARAIVEIGGVVIKPPDIYIIDGEAMLEWAVMRDPFGNEFCIIRWPLGQT
jgi:predicted enzyme related to lactoylglutathione lyase